MLVKIPESLEEAVEIYGILDNDRIIAFIHVERLLIPVIQKLVERYLRSYPTNSTVPQKWVECELIMMFPQLRNAAKTFINNLQITTFRHTIADER